MSDIIHTVGDVGTDFDLRILDAAGDPKDISAATVKEMNFSKPDGVVVTQTAAFITDGTDGWLRYVSVVDDTDIGGSWQREAFVDLPVGEWTSEVVGFNVKPRIGDSYYFADITRLEAINLMMAAAGEPPIDSFLGSVEADVILAMRILDAADRHVQLRGYSFNTEQRVTLTPVADQIILDADVVNVLPVYRSDSWTIRGGYLFDRRENTITITADAIVTLVRSIPFSHLPLHAQEWISGRAIRQFAERLTGEGSRPLREDEKDSKAAFMSAEANADQLRLGTQGPLATITSRRSPARRRNR